MKNTLIHITAILILHSCVVSKSNNFSYKAISGEINHIAKRTDTISQATYFSYKGTLIYFQYSININTTITGKKVDSKTENKTEKIFLIPANSNVFYQFDKGGNYLTKDSVRKSSHEFLKIDYSDGAVKHSMFQFLDNLKAKELKDTVFFGMQYKTCSPLSIPNDSLGTSTIQCFFIENKGLSTPFNMADKQPSIFHKYCFAGATIKLENVGATAFILYSDIKPITNEQEVLCEKIYKQVLKLK